MSFQKSPCLQPPPFCLFANGDEFLIGAWLGEEFGVRSLLHDGAVVHYKDLVGFFDGGETMGDGDHGLAMRTLSRREGASGEGREGFLDEVLVLWVDARCGFVEDDDGRVFEYRPGNGDALFFATAEGGAAFTDDGVIAVGQSHDEIVATCRFGGGDDFLF